MPQMSPLPWVCLGAMSIILVLFFYISVYFWSNFTFPKKKLESVAKKMKWGC